MYIVSQGPSENTHLLTELPLNTTIINQSIHWRNWMIFED